MPNKSMSNILYSLAMVELIGSILLEFRFGLGLKQVVCLFLITILYGALLVGHFYYEYKEE